MPAATKKRKGKGASRGQVTPALGTGRRKGAETPSKRAGKLRGKKLTAHTRAATARRQAKRDSR